MPDSISITSPAPNTTVGTSFTASGTVSPANAPVMASVNGTVAPVTVPGNGTWYATFNNVPPGTGSLKASIKGGPSTSESITVH